MGSKTPGTKVKQMSISCDVCDMKFQTTQALRVHKSTKHQRDPLIREYSPESTPKPMDTASAPSPTRTSRTPSSRISKRLQQIKNGTKNTEQKSEDKNSEEKPNIIEFACPKCNKVFPMYFLTLKHIEKKHPPDQEINSGTSDSPKLKPVRIEKLLSSNKEVDLSYNCNSSIEVYPIQNKNTLYCLGCDMQFEMIGSFNKHACTKHCEDSDSMFFKNHKEFHMWKQVMETQVKIKYLALKKTALQTHYQCNYVSAKNEQNKTYLCPSLVFVKYLQTGIQIHYGKKHYGHNCPEYQLPDEFSHLLTSKKPDSKPMNDSKKLDVEESSITADTHDELLSKFQNLMGNITEYAAKLSIPQLKKLLDSALQMQGILNSFDDDENSLDSPLINKSMTDDQITNALEGKRTSARLKRKSETRASVDAKKKKDITSDPDENAKSTVFKENKVFDSPNINARSSPSPLLSPSFVDSYKQFIGEPTLEANKKSKNDKHKIIVKTKIGQFSPKKQSFAEEAVVKNKQNIHPKKKIAEEATVKSKRNILKPSETNTSILLGNDIKYEVREQDNDCNILILKI